MAPAAAAGRRETAHRAASQAASDVALVSRIAAGDPLAMQVLFARHNVRVFRFVMGIVKDRTLADDIIGDVFLDVWRHAGRFEERASVSTWLLAIARYKALDGNRRGRAHAHVDLDEALAIADTSDDPETAAQTRDRDEVLRNCIAQLSPSHREILDLVYYQEMTIEAVAEIIGAPLNTVKTRMFYARKHIAAMLQEAGLDRAAL